MTFTTFPRAQEQPPPAVLHGLAGRAGARAVLMKIGAMPVRRGPLAVMAKDTCTCLFAKPGSAQGCGRDLMPTRGLAPGQLCRAHAPIQHRVQSPHFPVDGSRAPSLR